MTTPTHQIHVVTGAGPVGTTVALQLAERGHDVRLLTRSGSGPEHPRIERRRVDVSDPAAVGDAFAGATAIHHCIHGSRYRAATWAAELPAAERVVLDAAGRIGAVVVFPESLYSYGEVDAPITEATPRTATGGKPGVRTALLAARAASPTPTVSVVASDFFGPHVRNAHAGERMIPTVLAGRRMTVVADLDQPHSWTYVPDLAAAMVRAAEEPALWNTVLHAPTAAPLTQRELIAAIAGAGGVPMPRTSAIPVWAMRAIGLVHADTRELAEMGFQFSRPLVMESSESQRLLDLEPTPTELALKETVAWWRSQGA
ncbi:NAD-dependent epimerase/dehydratase family protein [Nocardioides sp. GY 10113]|uniref:NAD-dependent epimerase/dehydratase family protein n=1 Tax=Nocardioides sp. GY 10113 TaxID=2569761 RepID=UPI0010A8B75F|nr:NAD-dependent epimerase/dehydratase family protein [Nocardioides sp. GY 10113]TIC86737.1 NAD-dependent epimerase/dehydratase family protein [Nocardioides sp. GY 10113]